MGQQHPSTRPVRTSDRPVSSHQPISIASPGQPAAVSSNDQQPVMMAVPQPVPVRYVAGPQGGMVFMPQPVNECILYVILMIYFVSRLR